MMLRTEAIEGITERLSKKEGLYFPRAFKIDKDDQTSDPSLRKSTLFDLLSRDPPLFLERYGTQLTEAELKEFDAMKNDYEINWHLKHLRSLLSPTKEEVHTRLVKVKNRRRAYLKKLIRDGQYFSEEAMREREPYLHHEYVGKFQDPTSRCLARPGERWSETLMRRSEEALLVAKIRGEQQRLGILKKDWVGNDEEEEEEEEEEEDDGDGDSDKEKCGPHASKVDMNEDEETDTEPHEESISPTEMQDQMEQFTQLMHQKFLAGEDSHLDYSKIDDDETLDDHWMREANEDAEEKYFDED